MTPGKILLSLSIILFTQYSFAQTGYTVHRQGKMYLGVLGGMNFSGAIPTKKYSVLMSTPQSSNTMEKDYQGMGKNKGSQFGLYGSYSFTRKLSVVFEPGFQTGSFNYLTSYSWSDTVNGTNYNIEMMHEQKISAINLPLMARWDFSISQFSPYVQAGIYTSFRHHARQNIFYDNTIDGKVDKEKADQTGEADLTQHINKTNFGVTAGAGFTFFTNYFALSLESNFSYGFRSIVNDKNRYADYTGYSIQYLDVLDQLKLYNLNVQLTMIFPIDNSITLGILRKSKY